MNKGFTLIELLVVVLIIGILAAVALPQYETAVGKSRVAALLPLLRAVDTAEQVYYMSNGEYSMSFDKLDIAMPEGGTLTSSGGKDILDYTRFVCWFQQSADPITSSSVYCSGNQSGSHVPRIEKYFRQKNYICWADKNNEAQKKICSSLSGKAAYDTPGTTGTFFGYYFN